MPDLVERTALLDREENIARRAVLSVIGQRGGKIKAQKRITQTFLGLEEREDRSLAFNTPQFNSAHTGWLEGMGFIRSRRIFWELTADGRAALRAMEEVTIKNAA